MVCREPVGREIYKGAPILSCDVVVQGRHVTNMWSKSVFVVRYTVVGYQGGSALSMEPALPSLTSNTSS